MSRTARSVFALLALALFLAAGTAHALPTSNGPSPERVSGLAAAWEWLTSVFDVGDVFAPIFEASTGGTVPVPNQPTSDPQTDFGGFIDPNGGW
ncbi:MAG TPA: hypothetical protein VH394_31485 [Thermoanaerobaculia bacterium]|nr:hypothetical protein [Thermoanaerobaculia bacterium]